jgi:hypothetical protein
VLTLVLSAVLGVNEPNLTAERTFKLPFESMRTFSDSTAPVDV